MKDVPHTMDNAVITRDEHGNIWGTCKVLLNPKSLVATGSGKGFKLGTGGGKCMGFERFGKPARYTVCYYSASGSPVSTFPTGEQEVIRADDE